LRIPDVEHVDEATGLEGDVKEPAGRGAGTRRFEPADRFVVLLRGKRVGCEGEAESPVCAFLPVRSERSK
jgi:hypothetical protein